MRKVLRSLVNLSGPLGNVCEAHIFMDGGCNSDMVLQTALRLVRCFAEEMAVLHPDVTVRYNGLKNNGGGAERKRWVK